MIPVTQSQIANRVGITKQAVAYALSDRSELHRKLNPETRRRVLETAETLGYVPHNAARRLARSRSRSQSTSFDQIGLIYCAGPEKDLDPIGLSMMSGAEQEFAKLHASLTFMRVSEGGDWKRVERLAQSGGVDGWLLYGPVTDAMVQRLASNRLPLVILGDHECTQPVHSVNVDNEAVGRLAVQHLTSLGHRRIGLFGSTLRFPYQRQTRAGFQDAVRELRLDDDERLMIGDAFWNRWDHRVELWDSPNVELIHSWLQSTGEMPTALFTPEFDWASGVIRSLRQLRIKVPEEISIVSYEPFPHLAKAQNLTHIEIRMAELGHQGALLLHRLATESGIEPGEQKVAPALVAGGSTRPANSRSRQTQARP